MKKLALGVDIGGTSIKLGIFDAETLIFKWEIATIKEKGFEGVLLDISESIKEKLKDLNYTLEDVKGIGMGVPGPVLSDGFVKVCVNLNWKDVYPAKTLSKIMNELPVFISNDANLAALGEAWQGGAKGHENSILITLGTGVGGGVVVNGKLITGSHGLAGEIGHIKVKENMRSSCNCGAFGCLEQLASATGIVNSAKEFLKDTEINSKLRTYDVFSAKDVIDLAKANDELAVKTIEYTSEYLGIAIANLSLIINPSVFVIGGGVSRAGQYLVDIIEKYYIKNSPISEDRAKVVLASLGNDAGIYGGAKLVLS